MVGFFICFLCYNMTQPFSIYGYDLAQIANMQMLYNIEYIHEPRTQIYFVWFFFLNKFISIFCFFLFCAIWLSCFLLLLLISLEFLHIIMNKNNNNNGKNVAFQVLGILNVFFFFCKRTKTQHLCICSLYCSTSQFLWSKHAPEMFNNNAFLTATLKRKINKHEKEHAIYTRHVIYLRFVCV